MEVVPEERTMSKRGGSKLWVHDRFVVSLIPFNSNIHQPERTGQWFAVLSRCCK